MMLIGWMVALTIVQMVVVGCLILFYRRWWVRLPFMLRRVDDEGWTLHQHIKWHEQVKAESLARAIDFEELQKLMFKNIGDAFRNAKNSI